ncbi:MAG: histidine--tRNA ligase [Bacteroidales bacterium]|nr:histidine--tRNA ligase [Bacteroidales bacterium]
MNIVKPSIPKGTRDFTPTEMMRRNYIFDTIRSVFHEHAYLPIETPSMENLSILMGKYGEEGDRLLFKILNSGDFTKGVDFSDAEKSVNKLATEICEKGLRYDLTVPFARFVVQHQNEITFPFKRYQMQPVWRADRPQKGRYREFYQCDADIIGSNALLNEAELMEITDEIFTKFGISVTIKVNNRKILSGIAEMIGAPEKMVDFCTAMDKLDKIGRENVCAEMVERGISEEAIGKLDAIFNMTGMSTQEKLDMLGNLLAGSEIGLKGIEEVRTMLSYTQEMGLQSNIELDITLARGLNYYTGAIFEVKANDAAMGSISGGGRYDNLTGIFGLKNMSGVGISYGAERIYDVLNELNLFPDNILNPVKALFINFGGEDELYALRALRALRKAGIAAEIYPDNAKMGKQMTYANNKGIPFIIMAGENERNSKTLTIKDMTSGTQESLPLDKVLDKLTSC